jgi:UDP-N-acetylglucosamine 4,6-dehydratase
MTRFCITLDAAVRFAILCIEQMQGGEIFIPKTSSFCLADLAESIGRNCQIDYVGMRPGEKVHEVLVSEDESRNALELENMYVIQPVHPWWKKDNWMQGRHCPKASAMPAT